MGGLEPLGRRLPGAAPGETFARAGTPAWRAPAERRPLPLIAAPAQPAGRLVDRLLGEAKRRRADFLGRKWGVAPLEAAVALGLTTAEAVAGALAERLAGRLLPAEGPPPTLIGRREAWTDIAARGVVAIDLPGHGMGILVAPRPPEAEAMVARRHRVRPGPWPIFVTTPDVYAALVRDWAAREWADEAVNGLARDRPEASARDRALMTWTAAIAASLSGFILLAMAFGPAWLQLGLGSAIGVAVSLWAAFQLLAAFSAVRPLPRRPLADDELPHYTVLCALYKEKAVAGSLIAALERLDYPAAKLDIKLVLEADDAETLAAIRAAPLTRPVEVLILPDIAPRTKPKALMMALPFARGDLAVVYDAEDRPGRGQLREAAETFAAAPPALGCLQAPLAIHNSGQSWLTRFFAAEYDALFRVVLPALARHGLPMPLGGTSNHFRIEALRLSGGWDPYNVTEDADLGFRLAIAGWQVGTIATPTLEEAPATLRRWIGQRGRWFKGWLQTLAVLARRPATVARALGIKGTVGLLATIVGSIGSALVHLPTMVPLAAWAAFQGLPPFASLAAPVLLTGYGASLVCQAVGLRRGGHAGLIPWLLLVPGLWIVAGIAAMRAVHELATRPFHWEKTTHGLSPAPAWEAPAHDPAVVADVLARHRARIAAEGDPGALARFDTHEAMMRHRS